MWRTRPAGSSAAAGWRPAAAGSQRDRSQDGVCSWHAARTDQVGHPGLTGQAAAAGGEPFHQRQDRQPVDLAEAAQPRSTWTGHDRPAHASPAAYRPAKTASPATPPAASTRFHGIAALPHDRRQSPCALPRHHR
jgi:hypothetical protein